MERIIFYYTVLYTDGHGANALKRFYENQQGAEEFSRQVHGKIKMSFRGYKAV